MKVGGGGLLQDVVGCWNLYRIPLDAIDDVIGDLRRCLSWLTKVSFDTYNDGGKSNVETKN